MGEPILRMEGIVKRFPGVRALNGVDFHVAAGEVHALMGENGAGKSTLIKILTGAYHRDGGEVHWQGRQVRFDTPQEAQAAGISTIYQEVNLVPYLSVSENIFLGREPKNRLGLLRWSEMHREARELLAGFGIEVDVTVPLHTLGLATQQMVAIARAVSVSARLVVMDEPTSSLDEHEVQRLFGVVRNLKEQGVAVVFISHRLDEIYSLCDRVTILRDGSRSRSTLGTTIRVQMARVP